MIVCYFLKDRSTFLKLSQYLVTKNWQKNSFFNDSKLQFLINATYSYVNKYKKMPNEDIIYSMIEKTPSMDDYIQRKTKEAG